MRVALCFYGMVGFADSVYAAPSKGTILPVEKPYEYYKLHILGKNDVDVFMHCWNPDFEENLIRLYSPKGHLFEEQKSSYGEITQGHTYYRYTSRWYSNKETLRLKREYEKAHGFEYDFVMVTRYDLVWLTDVIFADFDPNCFYASKWNVAPYESPKEVRKTWGRYSAGKPLDFNNLSLTCDYLQDLWFFSNSKNVNYPSHKGRGL
jgi:hypothetical protein